jgi:ferrochelatase
LVATISHAKLVYPNREILPRNYASALSGYGREDSLARRCSGHDDPGYLKSLIETVNRSMSGFADPCDVDVIFSAHSVPIAVIESGDPYQRQVERTVDLVWQQGGWPARRHLCYQSKVGASRWLAPSMHETLCRLAAEHRKHLLIVPVSFVSDHVETLYEIDIEHRERARRLGIDDYRMTPGLNDSASFIQALAGLVRRALQT